MSIKTIYLFVATFLSAATAFSQTKIALIEEKTVISEKNIETGEKRRFSTSYDYRFTINGENEQGIGKYGKALRPNISDAKALALFDKSMRQFRLSNNLIYGQVLGGGVLLFGLYQGLTTQGDFVNPVSVAGASIALASTVVRSYAGFYGRQNLVESVRVHNESRRSSFLYKVCPDRYGAGLSLAARATGFYACWSL